MPNAFDQYRQPGGGIVTNFTQSAVIQTSQPVQAPANTKRIEALLCGAGGGGSTSGSGGFGGLQIFEIPITGYPLNLVIGAGSAGAIGGTTSVASAGTVYAAVGGGGNGNARFGGCGGGAGPVSGGIGGAPFPGKLLWSALDFAPRNGQTVGTILQTTTGGGSTSCFITIPPGYGGRNLGTTGDSSAQLGADAQAGWGSGGSSQNAAGTPQQPGAGGGLPSNGNAPGAGTSGNYGSGGSSAGVSSVGTGGAGGSLASLSIWGLTGFAGGAGATDGVGSGRGGGGGGMLSVGGVATASTNPGNGGNGGGGGGGGSSSAGGNGFAVLRFYF